MAGGRNPNWPTWRCSATIAPAMLSRAQEARVREILGSHLPGTIQTFCLEHLATDAHVPVAHLADLAAFVRNLRASGACQTQYGGTCSAGGHATARLLISARSSPSGQEARRVS
jgi:hypothetical protein